MRRMTGSLGSIVLAIWLILMAHTAVQRVNPSRGDSSARDCGGCLNPAKSASGLGSLPAVLMSGENWH